jgi:hypothetical protein
LELTNTNGERMTPLRSVTPLAVILVLVGCQPEREDWHGDYTFAWEGEHVTVYGYDRSKDEACGRSFAAVDELSGSIIELFGFDDSIHIDYHWMSSEFYEGKCPSNAGACTTRGDGPRTRSIPDMHEVAHALSFEGNGWFCPDVLEEGLAEYLSGPRFYQEWISQPELSARIDEILTKEMSSSGDYERAGHFVSFLLERTVPRS